MKTKGLDGLNDLHMIILSWLNFHPVTRLRTSTGLRADVNEIQPLCADLAADAPEGPRELPSGQRGDVPAPVELTG